MKIRNIKNRIFSKDIMQPTRSLICQGIGAVVLFSALILPGVITAQTTKLFYNYFKPTPIVCSPLTSNIWGASGVIPRDKCNGLQDQTGTQTIAPKWLYWDGKILRAKDGKYHMFATRWLQSSGHGNWWNSEVVHAVSDSSPIGPYIDKGYAYNNGPDSKMPHKGHNVMVLQLPDSTYAMIVSEIVPFTIFTSKSLDGPWANLGHASINTNGVAINIPAPGDQHLESNVSMVIRPDGNYEIIQRHGIIAISTTGLLGPYKVQQPTNKYPSNQQPGNKASIFPNRQKHTTDDPLAPGSVENTDVYAEDPLIWYGGGQYHVLYDYPDDRVGYHLTSIDGIHDWTDRGFAYDPRQAKQLFSYTDGTVAHWYKMERPNIYVENGHIKYFTYSVSDVDKGQISGGSNHGNNVIVMAFDGESFDKETGIVGTIGPNGGSRVGANAASLFVKEGSLRYSIVSALHVIIKIFNMQGSVVAAPVNSAQSAGLHTVSLPAALSSGSYLVSMTVGTQRIDKLVTINR